MGPGYATLHGADPVPLLTNVPWKRYVMVGEGTHTVIMEKNRQQLLDEVQLFLEEKLPD